MISGVMAAAPVADFSATPTSGTTSSPILFTDLSSNSPTGWAWFFGDETYSQIWTQQSSAAGWTGRYVFSSVVLPDGSIVLIGGRDTTLTQKNDTWRSTNKGETWIQQTSNAGWKPRSSHSSVVMSDGSIVMIGGANDTYYMNDTWRSTDKGVSWTQQTAKASWLARAGHSSVVMADGSIILIGGQIREGSNYYNKNDVWRSTDNGATWTQQTPAAGWTGRYGHSCVVMADGTIILTGGWDVNGHYKNDVWGSTDQGITWTEQSASASWTPRYSHTSVVMPDDSIVLMGGRPGYLQEENDTWRSTDKGISWTQLPDAGWPGRADFSSVALSDGSVVVMGGYDGINSFKKDVWRFNPVGSSAKNPSHIYNSAGVYNVALRSYNSDGYSNSIKNDYISVTNLHSSASGIGLPLPVPTTIPTPLPPPVADFSAATTMGMAPLNVAFTDQSTNNPSSWYWSFGDQTMSTLQHPTHVYANPGIYSVSLTATNSGGSHTKTRTSHIIVNKTEAITDFTGTPTSGSAPLTVAFTDLSGNRPFAWKWSFGDNNTSIEQNPSHTYVSGGTYTVALTTMNSTGRNTKTRVGYISISAIKSTPTVASISPSSGIKSKIVTITGITGSGFNSGATVRLTKAGKADIVATSVSVISATKISCNIDLSGAETGTWNVIVTNSDGKSGSLANGFAIKSAAPVAAFEATPTSGGVPLKITFTDKSTGDMITSRVWQYKLNSSSVWMTFPYGQSKSLTLSSAGSYDIKLTVKGTDGYDEEIKPKYINAGCDFSKTLGVERCFGGTGDQCRGVFVPYTDIAIHTNIFDDKTCQVETLASAGSIAHDRCCKQNPSGKFCDGVNFLGRGCEKEYDEADANYKCGRQWNQKFGPYYTGNRGDTEILKAPPGQAVNPLYQDVCQSGYCKKDCNGNPITKKDGCGEYCECSDSTDSTVCNSNPVLILHGIGDTVTNVNNSRLYAELSKTHKVYVIDYLSGPENAYGDIRTYAHTLDNKIREIKQQTHSEKVDIVAHSMGGLISRYRIQNIPNGEDDVDKLIMIGTPNHGSQISDQMNYCIPHAVYCAQHAFDGTYKQDDINQAINEMYPGSEFLNELNGNRATSEDVAKGGVTDKISNKVKYYVIAANYILNGDGAVMFDSAKLSGVPIYQVRASHIEQFSHQEVIDKVIELLAI